MTIERGTQGGKLHINVLTKRMNWPELADATIWQAKVTTSARIVAAYITKSSQFPRYSDQVRKLLYIRRPPIVSNLGHINGKLAHYEARDTHIFSRMLNEGQRHPLLSAVAAQSVVAPGWRPLPHTDDETNISRAQRYLAALRLSVVQAPHY